MSIHYTHTILYHSIWCVPIDFHGLKTERVNLASQTDCAFLGYFRKGSDWISGYNLLIQIKKIHFGFNWQLRQAKLSSFTEESLAPSQ